MKSTALGREKLDVSRYCGMTLSNLACHRQNRVPIVQAGGLKPLCDMAFDGERLEMQRAAGLALYNLSCSASNQVPLTGAVDRQKRSKMSRGGVRKARELLVARPVCEREYLLRKKYTGQTPLFHD